MTQRAPQVAHTIRIRDVSRNARYDLGPDVAVLRVPYDLFNPVGAVHRHGDLVDWKQGNDTSKSGRVVEVALGKTQPGERVLVKIDGDNTPSDEWWLCEIESVNDVKGQAGS